MRTVMSPSSQPFPRRVSSIPSTQNVAGPTPKRVSANKFNKDMSDKILPSLPAGLSQPGARPLSPVTEVTSCASSVISDLDGTMSTVPTYQTDATWLPPLQVHGGEPDGLEPLADEEIDPGSFDLVVPANANGLSSYTLEQRSKLLFSRQHLQVIFDDAILLHRFAAFLCAHRPASVPLFTYYLEALKALRAIQYSNAVARGLESLQSYAFTNMAPTENTINHSLHEKAEAAFELLAREDLPAYITHTWIQTVTACIKRRIAGTLPKEMHDLSEGLAEVFCLTDPSRRDNPIVFASEEFHKTTQYGMKYVIGRNCRFLQGPETNPHSSVRIREHMKAGKEHFETFLNYRRDGTPFMNLLMIAPLYDSRGKVRYHLGAQVDVSGLVKEAYGLDSFKQLVEAEEAKRDPIKSSEPKPEVNKDAFQELSELLNFKELEIVRQRGGHVHRPETQHHPNTLSTDLEQSPNWKRSRVLIQDGDSSASRPSSSGDFDSRSIRSIKEATNTSQADLLGRLTGVYEHYVLVRPYPSLRVLFASPSLRVPGMLQSHLLDKIGGSGRVRDELQRAMEEGQKVTAKVRWVASRRNCSINGDDENEEGRSRWIHCTPLQGGNGAVGVWMVVVVDDETEAPLQHQSRYTPSPLRSTNGRSQKNPTSDSESQRAAVHDYHSVTRALHHQGSSSALRAPTRTRDTISFGLSGLDVPKTSSASSSIDKTMWSNAAMTSEPWGQNREGKRQWAMPAFAEPGRDADGDDMSVKSVASSAFTVRIGDD